MNDFLVAIGLVLVIEGLLWAAFPGLARRMLETVAETPENALRLTALVVAAIGISIVAFMRAA